MNWTEKAIRKLADENPDGFTVDLFTGKKVLHGVAVGMTHGLTAFDAALIANLYQETSANIQFSHRTIGGWKDGDKYVIDVGVVALSVEGAKEFGQLYEQEAIFDLDLQTLIKLK